MKRILLTIALATLVLPATALAKGPSEASLDGPGLGKPITFTGTEEPGTPLGDLTAQAGFFPAAFEQQPDPMLAGRPKGNLGPKYTIAYTVPGPEGEVFHIRQGVYPYAKPWAVTYMAPGQELFRIPNGTRGGWYESPALKETLIRAGLPKVAPAPASSSAGFLSGRVGAVVGAVILLAAAGWFLVRRRPSTFGA